MTWCNMCKVQPRSLYNQWNFKIEAFKVRLDSTEGEDTFSVASVAYTYPMHECRRVE